MRSSEKEKLLEDLIRDANYEAFREEVRELSLAEFRAARRPRRRLVYLALAASVVLLGTVLAVLSRTRLVPGDAAGTNVAMPQMASSNSDTSAAKVARAFQKDRPASFAFIGTAELKPVEVVRSLADLKLVVRTGGGAARGIEVVRSDPATVDAVTDAELLALFPHDGLGFFQTPSGKKLVVIGELPFEFETPVRAATPFGAIP